MESGKIALNYKLNVITPVHIGGAQEKHYQHGIDFVASDDMIVFLDEKKILDTFGIDKYSSWLENRTLAREIKNKGVQNFTRLKMRFSGSQNNLEEIKKNIRSQGKNVPLIPGSSLKGAIRSVLLNWVKTPTDKKPEQEIFGKIPEDPFRFVQIPDIEFAKTMLINTKIFNLHRNDWQEWEGGWKNGRSDTSHKFYPSSFNTLYECIATQSTASLSININKQSFSLAKNVSQSLNKLFEDEDPQNYLFNIVKAHAIRYLEREIAFFQRFQAKVEHSEEILKMYKSLLQLANRPDTALLRIGQGSGFHAMTGDWKYDNHLDPVEVKTMEGNSRGSIYLKSRKLGFIKGNSGYTMIPLGFLSLSK